MYVAPGSSPQDVALSPISSTSIRVSWSPPPIELQNGEITLYRINLTEVDTGNNFTYTTQTTSLSIQFLHPYYIYKCIVSAYTVAESPYSVEVTIQTPEDGKK